MGHKGVSKRKPKQARNSAAPETASNSRRGISKDAVLTESSAAQAVTKSGLSPTPAKESKSPAGTGKKRKKKKEETR